MDSSPELKDKDYDAWVKTNIAFNREVLKNLGLLDKPAVSEQKPRRPRKSSTPRQVVKSEAVEVPHRIINTRRSSLLGRNINGELGQLSNGGYDEENTPPHKKAKKVQETLFGEIEGVQVGDWWMTRMECSAAGVHRPTVAGIHGKVGEGCYSIALSGGYMDDIDCGECFTYTGSGGRDLKGTKSNPKNLRTAPQSKDQILEGVNLALASNMDSKKPVRVIRGYKLDSPYAPEEGYRYDGLYSVEKFWTATGLSGFKVLKFAMKRLPDQDPPPWTLPNSLHQSPSRHMQLKSLDEEPNVSSVNTSLVESESSKTLSTVKTDTSVVKDILNSSKNGPIVPNEIYQNGDVTDSVNGISGKIKLTPNRDSTMSQSQISLTLLQHGQLKFNSKDTSEQNCNGPKTPTNLSEKKVRFSPRILYAGDLGNSLLNSSEENSDDQETCINGSEISSNSDTKKQTSILKYFTPSKKLTENLQFKPTVNPKSLRSNRFSSFTPMGLTSEIKSENFQENVSLTNIVNENLSSDGSKSNGEAKRQNKSSRKYFSYNKNKENSLNIDLSVSKVTPSMMENLIKQNNDKLRLHSEVNAKKRKNNSVTISPIKHCYVGVVRLEESFSGWEPFDEEHYGFSEEEIIISKQDLDQFQIGRKHSSKSHLSSIGLSPHHEDFHGFDTNQDFCGSSGLVPIAFMIENLSGS